MFLAKAPDKKMIKNPSLSKGIHYWIVGKTKSKKPHLVEIRTTHWVDPESEGYLNRGDGILLRFKGISQNHPTLVLRDGPRTKDVKGNRLTLADFIKIEDLSPEAEERIRKFLKRNLE